MKALGNRASVVLQPQPSHQAWVEVYHPEVRKAVALLALAARLGIAPEEIIYFGDSLNDLEVMRAVGYPVAMGNALPEVKAVAWRVAPSNNEEGVARVLAELFGI
jgi:hydroxymethylpyrimidine pyrophosphatase-like HAD family hydrolase